MLSKYKCMIKDHKEQKIRGICENINCKEQYRRVCFSCYEIHFKNDNPFNIEDIKNEEGIQIILDESKINNRNQINNIQIQCQIQQFILILQMIEYMEQWMFKQQQLFKIIQDLKQFYRNEFQQINITNYLQNSNNIGIYQYLQQIQNHLQNIEQAKNDYLTKINDKFSGQRSSHQEDYDYKLLTDQFIQILEKNKSNLFQNIIQNDEYKKVQQHKNPYQIIYEILKNQTKMINPNAFQDQKKLMENLINQYINKGQSDTNNGIEITNLDQRQILQQKEQIEEDIQDNKKQLFQNDIIMDQQLNKEKSIQYLYQGISFKIQQRYQEAILMYDEAIKLDPKCINAYNHKGNSLHSLGRYQEAIEMYNKAIKIDPNCVDAYNNIGISLAKLSKYEEAIKIYDLAIQIDPKYVDAYCNKGNSLHNLEQYEESIKMFDKAIDLDPENAILYNNKGNSLYNLQRYQDALEMYETALNFDPKCVDAYNNKGNTLHNLQKYEEAIIMYDVAIYQDPQYNDAYQNRMHSVIKLRKPDNTNSQNKPLLQQL